MPKVLATMNMFTRLGGLLTNRTFAATGAISLLSTAIVVAAVQSDGSTATNVQLDDGTVWVTDLDDGRIGRLNVQIKELDFSLDASRVGDVLQETVPSGQREPERTVLFVPEAGGVKRFDVLTANVAGGDNEIPIVDYRIGGGVAALLDRDSGRLWVGSAQQVLAPEYPEKPDALVEPGSWLVVTQAPPVADEPDAARQYGRVIVVDGGGWFDLELDSALEPVRAAPSENEESDESTTTTTTTTIPDDAELEEPDPAPLKEPVRTALGVSVDRIAEVSAVGPEPVVLLDDGTVVLADGTKVAVPGDDHRLQQVGAEWSNVLVASDAGLFEVDAESGEVTRLVIADATPSAPVRLGECVWGAWSGAIPKRFRACNDETSGLVVIPGAEPDSDLVWRVNQNSIALNSTGNGDIWADHDGTLAYVGNWSDVEPRSQDSDDDRDSLSDSGLVVDKECIEGGAEVPTAGDDQLDLRPRQSIIDVLYNDDDRNCEPIAVTAVEPASGDWGQLTIIGNGQHLLYSPSDSMVEEAAESIQTFQFTYVVSDIGGNRSSPATVTIRVKDYALGNSPPGLRPKSDDSTREMRAQVEEGRAISYDVLPDWWDPDGDDLRLVSAVAENGGEVAATPDGVVRFFAYSLPAGVYPVAITMADGPATSTETLEVTVKPTGSVIPPVTSNDFVTMVKGSTTTIAPLENDSDPNEDPLSLRPLWTAIDEPGYAATVKGDTVELTANEAGVYALDYEATDGTDATKATIRLEIIEPGDINSGPIAVPDQVKLRPNRVVNVDVLANDVDADGDMLAVVDVDVATSDPAFGVVRATLVDRRMVQIEVAPGPNGEEPTGPFTVTYVVSDGREAERAATLTTDEALAQSLRARGAVSVLVQPSSQDQPPVLTNDAAVVRSGDVVAVPVLRNDIDPDSDTITLVGVDEVRAVELEAAGEGVVWVQGREVYFQGGAPGRYSIPYTAEAAGRRASAELSVVVNPLPDPETNPNQPPEPPDLELRAVRNGIVRVRIPTFGIDPDGDSVILLDELGTPGDPNNLVVVDAENPGTVLFTAGRNAGSSDSFTYTVRDRFGEKATGTVKVMVLDDGGWAPRAFDDVFRGKPDRVLTIPVVANDTSPQDRRLEIAELPFFDVDGQPSATPQNADRVRLLDQENPDTRGLIEVRVPTDDTVLVESYRISDGINPSDAAIRVTPDPDAPNIPPVALPDEVTAAEVQGLTEATVDVIANDYDPDDAESPLRLSLPANQNATLAASGQLVVPLAETPQIVLYRITDSDGASAIGMVRVPGLENHPPQLSAVGRDPEQRIIDAATGDPLTILLDVITEDPDGDPDIRLTDTDVTLNGVGEIRRLDDGTGFVYTPPAELTTTETVTVTFEVTDRPDRTLAERQLPNCNCLATLTVGVIVEASSPPYVVAQGAVPVPQLFEPVTYDLAPLTRDDQGDELTYRLDPSSFGGLDVEQSGSVVTIVSRREGDQKIPVGSQIRVGYTVSDGVFDPVANSFVVTMVATNKGQPAVKSFPPIEAERSVSISTPNLVVDAFNPFGRDGSALTLVSSSVSGGARVNCTPTGFCEFVSDTVGTFTITYTLEDAIDQTATGTLDVVVKGKPLAPTMVRWTSVGDKVVNLAWSAPDDQGSPISHYVVTNVDTGERRVFESIGGPFDGLQNAQPYRFTVAAVNELGEGAVSGPTSAATPDRVPDPPEGLEFTGYADQTLSVRWTPPSTAGDFSTIVAYEVRLGGQMIRVDGGVTNLTIGLGGQGDPLSNGTDYVFEVRAQNSATTNGGWGAWSNRSPSTERPSRFPDPPTDVSAVNAGDGGSPRLSVTWNAPANDGGRAVNQYRVCRIEDGSCQTVAGSTRQATFPAVGNTSSSFTVVAFNTDTNRNNSDPSAASLPVVAVRSPDAPVISSVTSGDRTLVATASTTNNSGCSNVTVEYSRNGGSTWQPTGTFTGLVNGTQYTIIARARLASTCGTPGVTYVSANSAGFNQTPYGPLVAPTMTVSRSYTTITWNWNLNTAANNASGRTWTATMTGACSSASATSGSFSNNFGNTGQTYTCRATISAPGVAPLFAERSATVPGTPSVSISFGGSAEGELQLTGAPCSANCLWVNVTVVNFAPGDYGAHCEASDDGWIPWTSNSPNRDTIANVDSSGTGTARPCYYGFLGRQVRVVVNGITSNTLTR